MRVNHGTLSTMAKCNFFKEGKKRITKHKRDSISTQTPKHGENKSCLQTPKQFKKNTTQNVKTNLASKPKTL
jgi:hypothetical protein